MGESDRFEDLIEWQKAREPAGAIAGANRGAVRRGVLALWRTSLY